MTANSSGSRLPDSFRSEWSPLHSLKPACTHHAYCSQQVPPQSTRAPQWYLTKSKASLIGTSVAIFAHGVEAITLFWQHSVSSVLAFPPLSLSLSVSSYSRKRLSSILHGGAMSSALSSAPCRRGCLSDALLSNHFIVAGYAPTHTDLAFRFLRFRRGLSAILFGRATLCPWKLQRNSPASFVHFVALDKYSGICKWRQLFGMSSRFSEMWIWNFAVVSAILLWKHRQ